ncbi:hypothetical protein BB558_006811 [Smittium angustum]|uniref:Uncharacterized protein n=1 Tax=Smittium angustum TaxID=133377 RepID=A0A2U1IWR8_SMIAN|nr:hypothetical protein BB558_006811 [Smittium angustum]
MEKSEIIPRIRQNFLRFVFDTVKISIHLTLEHTKKLIREAMGLKGSFLAAATVVGPANIKSQELQKHISSALEKNYYISQVVGTKIRKMNQLTPDVETSKPKRTRICHNKYFGILKLQLSGDVVSRSKAPNTLLEKSKNSYSNGKYNHKSHIYERKNYSQQESSGSSKAVVGYTNELQRKNGYNSHSRMGSTKSGPICVNNKLSIEELISTSTGSPVLGIESLLHQLPKTSL